MSVCNYGFVCACVCYSEGKSASRCVFATFFLFVASRLCCYVVSFHQFFLYFLNLFFQKDVSICVSLCVHVCVIQKKNKKICFRLCNHSFSHSN